MTASQQDIAIEDMFLLFPELDTREVRKQEQSKRDHLVRMHTLSRLKGCVAACCWSSLSLISITSPCDGWGLHSLCSYRQTTRKREFEAAEAARKAAEEAELAALLAAEATQVDEDELFKESGDEVVAYDLDALMGGKISGSLDHCLRRMRESCSAIHVRDAPLLLGTKQTVTKTKQRSQRTHRLQPTSTQLQCPSGTYSQTWTLVMSGSSALTPRQARCTMCSLGGGSVQSAWTKPCSFFSGCNVASRNLTTQATQWQLPASAVPGSTRAAARAAPEKAPTQEVTKARRKRRSSVTLAGPVKGMGWCEMFDMDALEIYYYNKYAVVWMWRCSSRASTCECVNYPYCVRAQLDWRNKLGAPAGASFSNLSRCWHGVVSWRLSGSSILVTVLRMHVCAVLFSFFPLLRAACACQGYAKRDTANGGQNDATATNGSEAGTPSTAAADEAKVESSGTAQVSQKGTGDSSSSDSDTSSSDDEATTKKPPAKPKVQAKGVNASPSPAPGTDAPQALPAGDPAPLSGVEADGEGTDVREESSGGASADPDDAGSETKTEKKSMTLEGNEEQKGDVENGTDLVVSDAETVTTQGGETDDGRSVVSTMSGANSERS